jgi:hypothetical protein
MIKVTEHKLAGRWVVNTPGTHIQRQPRVYASKQAAFDRVDELQASSGDNLQIVIVTV